MRIRATSCGPFYDGLATGVHEVLADDTSRRVKAGLSRDLEFRYPELV